MVNNEKIGALEEKYSMLFRDETYKIMGTDTILRVKFNCLKSKTITEEQITNYLYFKNNIAILSDRIEMELKVYAGNRGYKDIANCKISSVEFSDNNNFFLADVPWDVEQGIAILFDNSGKIEIVEADEVL